MKLRLFKPFLGVVAAAALSIALTGCGSTPLKTRAVTYQALRVDRQKNPANIGNAEIAVLLVPSARGNLDVVIRNQSNRSMIIDQTMSTFIDTDGRSYTYYDPTVRTVTNSETHGGSSGASVNLGSVAGLLGIGGVVGGLLGGINVGGSSSSGTATSETTYFADMPRITVGPKGTGAMSKTFSVSGLKLERFLADTERSFTVTEADTSPLKFSVTIFYSLDNGETFKEITTVAFVSTQMVQSVADNRMINNSVRAICLAKSDALSEYWWRFGLVNNYVLTDYRGQYVSNGGALINYQ